MARRTLRAFVFDGVCVALVAGACAGETDETGEPVGQSTALLTRATSCEDLLARVQADAIAQLDVAAEQAVDSRGGLDRGGVVFGEPAGPSGAGAAANAGDPMSAGDGSSGDATGPTSFSDTNVQVEGVDEADIVKTDGQRIYLLHGSDLFLMKSFPAEESAILGSAPVEGDSREMFVTDGKAVVFTTLWDTTALYDVGPGPGDGYYGGAPFTKVTVFDVEGDTPSVLRESYVEGDYLSARRHGTTVRAVMQDGFKVPEFYPDINYYDAWGKPYPEAELKDELDAWKARMTKDIRSSTLDQWLPLEREKVGGELVALEPRCTDYYVPMTGMTAPGVTTVVSLDLGDLAAPFGGATILGDAHELYANNDVLLLAHDDWRWMTVEDSRHQTALHRFDISGGDTVYTASGFAPGYIHDQFSLDERGGVIRLATTERLYERVEEDGFSWLDETGLVNRVTTMGVDGTDLVELGSTGDFGEGEEVYSARFVGDRGYVVTYMQTDPLFVIELSDPAKPTILGHLEIPGFSDYMHPLDESHLLTIGRETEVTPEGWTQDIGLQLQIFDVSDPMAPIRTHQHLYTTEGYSEANHEHKAFTYFAEKGLLAFPFTSYGMTFKSSLEVFRVDVGTGFEQLGSVDHTELFATQCGESGFEPYCDPSGFCEPPPPFCGPEAEVRRGLFIDDFVYSISYGGMLVHALSDLVTPVATIPLPLPSYGDGPYYGVDGSVSVGGAAPAGGTNGTATGGGTADGAPATASGGGTDPAPVPAPSG